jgi:hypothetical protein
MRLGEALATCPELELVEQDPATAEQAWEEILRRLEDAGFAVEPGEPGTVFFESKGVERLYGGLEPAPSPNGWGRTDGAPGTWRGERRRGRWRRDGRRPPSTRRSSSRRRSATS